MHVDTSVKSHEDCLRVCKDFKGCKWFTFINSSLTCLVMADCKTLDETCQDCVSGEFNCEIEDDDGKG